MGQVCIVESATLPSSCSNVLCVCRIDYLVELLEEAQNAQCEAGSETEEVQGKTGSGELVVPPAQPPVQPPPEPKSAAHANDCKQPVVQREEDRRSIDDLLDEVIG